MIFPTCRNGAAPFEIACIDVLDVASVQSSYKGKYQCLETCVPWTLFIKNIRLQNDEMYVKHKTQQFLISYEWPTRLRGSRENMFDGIWHVIRIAILKRCGNEPVSAIFQSISKMGKWKLNRKAYLFLFCFLSFWPDSLRINLDIYFRHFITKKMPRIPHVRRIR